MWFPPDSSRVLSVQPRWVQSGASRISALGLLGVPTQLGVALLSTLTLPPHPPRLLVLFGLFFSPHFSSSHTSYNMKACRKLKVVVFVSRACHILYLLRSEYWQQRPNRIRTPWPSLVSRLFHDWIWSGILRSTSKQFVVPWLVQFPHQGRWVLMVEPSVEMNECHPFLAPLNINVRPSLPMGACLLTQPCWGMIWASRKRTKILGKIFS